MTSKKSLYSGPTKAGITKQPGKKKTKPATASLETLKKVRKTTRVEYGHAKKTRGNYKGHFARGQKFLAELVSDIRANGGSSKLDLPELAGIDSDGDDLDDVDVDLLEKAFDKPPNKYSVSALELFLVQKCCTEGLSASTAVGIHGAYCDYWDNMDGDTYGGKSYEYDQATGTVKGNPARSSRIRSYIRVINSMNGEKGSSMEGRHHAEAMRLEDITQVMNWSELQCPPSKLCDSPKDLNEMMHSVKHGLMRAFMTTGFVLWTRNFELTRLKRKHITFDCHGKAPYHAPYFTVLLENRKGWQKKMSQEGTLRSNIYNVYKQDIPEIDMFTHLPQWINYLEGLLGRNLGPDECIFPYFRPNGIPDMSREMTQEMVQSLINSFTSEAGLSKYFTTHCFRRGGAQYRFMYAPIGQRWSLCKIRWWGGWANGEHVDTLIKYLVDSLQSYETDYGDALCPMATEADKSFMGDHVLIQPVTTNEFRMFSTAIFSMLEKAKSSIPNSTMVPPTNSFITPGILTATNNPFHDHNLISQGAAPTPSPLISPDPAAMTPDMNSSTLNEATNLPIMDINIPDLPRCKGTWERAIAQWFEPDPTTGIALKDWPVEWYTGIMRSKTGSKRSHRALVAEEYTRLGSTREGFLCAYPDADTITLTTLLNTIRGRQGHCRSSKNGTPAQRGTGSRSMSPNTPEPEPSN